MPSRDGERLIRTAVRDRVFAPVYCFHGGDDFLKDEAVHRLLDAAVDGTTRDFNLEIRRGSDIDAETLGSLLITPPMMADRRAVVIRDVSSLRKDARRALDDYLRKPALDTMLILVVVAGVKLDQALAERSTVVEFEPLTGARLPKWIAYYAEHVLHTTIEPEAIALLQDSVGGDLAHLAVELEKLGNFCSGRPIDETAVAAVVGIHRNETLGGLLDAIGRRDAGASLALLPDVLHQPKSGAVPIVMALTLQTLGIAWARARRDHGTSSGRQQGELFTLLKEAGGAFTGRSWDDAVKAWVTAVDLWTSEELVDACELLLATDRALKETRVSSEEQALASLILELCGSSVRRRVA